MKRIILFFAVCLGLSISGTTFADNEDAVRAATKRTQNQTVSATTNSTNTTNRSVSSNARKTENIQNKNSRTAIKSQPQKVVSRTSTKNQNVKTRTTIQQPTKQAATSQTTKRVNTPSRQPTNARTLSVNKLPITVSSNRTARSAVKNASKRTAARTAELDSTKISNIKSLDYSKCKTVYYECMDEFCANKDSNLRRCACSARIHEFDNIKQQLNDAEDRMNEFNQRLLTVRRCCGIKYRNRR